jgi:tripartite-type tricarboxylate transporter receptor subunit TctC
MAWILRQLVKGRIRPDPREETRMINLAKLSLAGVCLVALTGLGAAHSADFPSRPITVVVPFGAGGTADVMSRLLSERVSAELGQSVVVENKAGAGGIIGAEAVRQSPPDGYSIVVFATTHIINPSVQKVSYDWENDFRPVFGTYASPQAFVVAGGSPIKSMADLVAAAQAKPEGLTYSSGGLNSLSQLTSAVFAQTAKIQAVHIPYPGLSPAMQAILAKEVDFGVINLLEVQQFAKAGTARVLAVTTQQRASELPDVPTVSEAGFPSLNSVSWNAYLVPKATPDAVVDKLTAAFRAAANDPTVQSKANALGVRFDIKNNDQVHDFMASEYARWNKVIVDNGLDMKN